MKSEERREKREKKWYFLTKIIEIKSRRDTISLHYSLFSFLWGALQVFCNAPFSYLLLLMGNMEQLVGLALEVAVVEHIHQGVLVGLLQDHAPVHVVQARGPVGGRLVV